MRSQWPIWVFVIGVIVIVLFAFNYQGGNEYASLSEIFPEEEMSQLPDIEYEFVDDNYEDSEEARIIEVDKTDAAQDVAAAADKAVTVTAVKAAKDVEAAATKESAPAVKIIASAPPKISTTDFKNIPFTIQVSSSKNKAAAQAALKGVKAAGYENAYIVERNLGDKGTWYRIYIGKFDTKQEANNYITKVRTKYKDSFIIAPK